MSAIFSMWLAAGVPLYPGYSPWAGMIMLGLVMIAAGVWLRRKGL